MGNDGDRLREDFGRRFRWIFVGKGNLEGGVAVAMGMLGGKACLVSVEWV